MRVIRSNTWVEADFWQNSAATVHMLICLFQQQVDCGWPLLRSLIARALMRHSTQRCLKTGSGVGRGSSPYVIKPVTVSNSVLIQVASAPAAVTEGEN